MIETNQRQDLEAFRKMCTRWEKHGTGRKCVAACEKLDGDRCSAYSRPYARFRVGGCALCSIPPETVKRTKQTVNALKASKRAARGN